MAKARDSAAWMILSAMFIVLGARIGESPQGVAAAHWANIGGCGTSSGGAASDLGLKWIGRGLSGYPVEAEAVAVQSYQSDSAVDPDASFDGRLRVRTNSFLLSALYHAPWADLKAALPLIVREANILGNVKTTGPLGDLSLEAARGWGESRALRTRAVVGFPTGPHDIPFDNVSYMLPELQTGSGLFTATLAADRAFERDWGFFAFGGSWSGGFAALTTTGYAYDAKLNKAVSSGKTFRFAREGAGARNDIGTLQPDNLSLFADLGIRSEAAVQGFTAGFGLPLGKAEYEERNQEVTAWSAKDPSAAAYFPARAQAQVYADTLGTGSGSPRYRRPSVAAQDAQGRWIVMEHAAVRRATAPSLTLQYSLERSDIHVPLLFGGSARWEFDGGPVFAGFGLGMGVKFGMD
jgi:hypothetical protein